MSAAVRKSKQGLIIKPVKKATTNDIAFRETWQKLSQAITEIYRKNNSQLSYEELYRSAYNLVLQKNGSALYNGVRDDITTHLTRLTGEKLTPVFPHDGSLAAERAEFLRVLVRDVWNHHVVCMGMIRDILMYMDRVYVKAATPPVPLVYDLGMDLFRDHVLHSTSLTITMSGRVVDSMLELIRLERSGESVDRIALKGVADMMHKLESGGYGDVPNGSVYEADFEKAFLVRSGEAYDVEAEAYLAEVDAVEYLKKVERRLAEEEQRTRHYLIPITAPKILKVVQRSMLERHVVRILSMPNSGLLAQLRDLKFDDLIRMYDLMGLVGNGHVEMRKMLSDYVKESIREVNETYGPGTDTATPSNSDLTARAQTGMQSGGSSSSKSQSFNAENKGKDRDLETAGDDEEEGEAGQRSGGAQGVGGTRRTGDPLRWVENILALKTKFDSILARAFSKDRAFQTDINGAFERGINQNPKAPEFLSLFLDDNLRKGIKGKTEAEVEVLLDQTITLFRFIQEKDVFERYYKGHLAKRLLLGKSLSEDAEKSTVGKLKAECGYQFTTKLEGMFNDMRISTDLSSDFRSFLNNLSATGLPEFTVNVLTSTFWPMGTSVPPAIQLPIEIQSLMQRFKEFYMTRHSGRRLTWLTTMGSFDLRAHFEKGRKDINLSTAATSVLVVVFNRPDACDGQAVPYSRIRDETGIPDGELRRTLQSLSLGKYRVLLKSAKGREILDDDEFRLNVAFSSPLNKIRILNILPSGGAPTVAATGNSVEDDKERRETLEKVEQARIHQIEACVVRVMKARKSMEHNALVNEVVSQLKGRFLPSSQMVKKRIESLIEREYLDRAPGDRKVYNYLA
ncbi:Cullin-domain-containing protein [Gonapodya prolifera JEL478]|uniref:Cullin-domain-containing protein n=1 Tax=Gonapodya prolifera (strain JEL478) TaxID=1344416 RepID=A0A139AEN3_GONPJ|nr:Cullin-domain-containing protein [Gonapodya prolifera JEL478]|eukprot:KXS15129.1 Cullin-domain-containing protein [Gonapodya prolifera JEL478]